MLGLHPRSRPLVGARLTTAITSPTGKRQLLRGRLGEDEHGRTVTPVGGAGSHLLGGLAGADALIVVGEGTTALDAGSRADVLIREAIPDLQYAVKWKKGYYGLPAQGWVIELVAYDVSVNVVFLGGADFATPPPLGDTGRSRYTKVRSLDEVESADMGRWIEQAASVPGWSAEGA
jgi:hypothetical protein